MTDMNTPFTSPESTSDDRLWALLSYLLTPLIPIVILLMEDKKNRPFIKAHSMQALALGVVLVVINTIGAFIPIVGCIFPIATLVLVIFYGVKAYRGEYIEIPVISNFVKSQGWA
jgi:uncharacterized membrane protein